MILVPAAFLGILVVFFLGYAVTSGIFSLIDRYSGRGEDFSTTARKEHENEVDSLVGGGVFVVIFIFILLNIPREQAIMVWWGLNILGVIAGISTFFLFRSDPDTSSKSRQIPTNASWTYKHVRPSPPSEYKTSKNEEPEKRDPEQERFEQRQAYQNEIHERQKKQAEMGVIQRDLFALFGIPPDQHQKRGKLLETILGRLFQANNIPLWQPFELTGQMDHRGSANDIAGVIKLGRGLYLVKMLWQQEPLGMPEISQCLVDIFSHSECVGGIIITNTRFSATAVETCKEALPRKIVVLCELDEIVALLEKNDSLERLLTAKIMAAVDDRNPLFKTSTQPGP